MRQERLNDLIILKNKKKIAIIFKPNITKFLC